MGVAFKHDIDILKNKYECTKKDTITMRFVTDYNWIEILLGLEWDDKNPYLIIRLFNYWKKNKPSKEVLEDLKFEINLISIYYSKTNEIITYGTQEYKDNRDEVKEYHYLPDEKSLLERIIIDFRKKRVDIITGWNIKLFDIPYIINRCKELEIELSLSPLNIYKDVKIRDDYGNTRNAYTIAGI